MARTMKKRPTPTSRLRRRLLAYQHMREEIDALKREIEKEQK